MALATTFYRSQKLLHIQMRLYNRNGFTLIELMIVVAIIAIILVLALPVFADYTIRAKISEALSVSMSAKTAVSSTCQEDPLIDPLTPQNSDYSFPEPTEYVTSVTLTGPCTLPVITIVTQFTGASQDPILTISGTLTEGNMTFICTSDGPNKHVPKTCRS